MRHGRIRSLLTVAGALTVALTAGVPRGIAAVKVLPGSISIPLDGGEIASAVVPPGKKRQCPAGRVLIANDSARPGNADVMGIVKGIDLKKGASVVVSTHDAPPLPTDFMYSSNDQNLVSLPNGDVVYQAAAFSKGPAPGTDPAWFPVTFRGGFGPRARNVQLSWRSEDCGATFKFAGAADPLEFSEGGECANPQGTGTAGDAGVLVYDAGGSDGPRLDVDRKSGRLILTYGCVGEFPLGRQPESCEVPLAEQPPGSFRLSGCPLNLTYVVRSDDKGATWQRAGRIKGNQPMWRGAAVPTKNGLAVAFATSVFFGRTLGEGYDFGEIPTQLPGKWGYDDVFPSGAIAHSDAATSIDAGIVGPALLTRVPGHADLLLTGIARTLDASNAFGLKSRTHGYAMFLKNIDTRAEAALPPVLPMGGTAGDVVMHLTAIDLGVGPVLLYWYDVSTSKKTALIRGRLFYGADVWSDDFTISRFRGADAPFELKPASLAKPHFYGDYKMAEGFAGRPPASALLRRTYTFLPAWVQADGTAHVGTVEVSVGLLDTDAQLRGEGLSRRPARFLPPGPVGADVTSSITDHQLELLREHDVSRGRKRPRPVP